MKKIVACAILSGLTTVAAHADVFVTGHVTDEQNEPIVGAIITVPGTQLQAVSSADGTFSLSVPDNATQISLRYLGYRSQTLTVKGGDNVSVQLAPDFANQDSWVDNGGGQTVTSAGYTGARSEVGSATIMMTPSVNLDQTLVGRLSGMTNMQGSSTPGSDGTTDYIRGRFSSNGTAVLCVLDGVPAPTIDPNTIDPNTVESVTLLKDAAAKALYGPLGAQGVLLIKTKQGKVGKTEVRADVNFGINGYTEQYDPLDAYTYATLRNQALANDGLPALFTDEQMEAFRNGTGINNDWKKLFFKNHTTTQLYNVSGRGGTDRVQFYLNAGYAHQDGIYKAEENEKYNPTPTRNRFTVVSNVKVNLFKYLSANLNTNVRIYRENGSKTSNSSILQGIMRTPATVPGPLTDDGKIITTENFTTPVYARINRSGYTKSTGTDVNANFGLNLDMSFLTKGLSANATVGYHSYYVGSITGTTDYTRYVYDSEGNAVPFGTNVDSPLSLGKSSNTLYFMNVQASIVYDRTFFDKLAVKGVLNYLAEDKIGSGFDAKSTLPYRRLQYAAQLHLGWDNRYFVQGTLTDAGTEQFMKGHQFKVSPTVSAAWNITGEHFMRNVRWLNLLKLRASYGALKYDNVNSVGRLLYSSDIRQQNGSGYINSLYTAALIKEYVLGNPNLTWEVSRQQNYGVDFTLFNALKGSFDYWITNQDGVIGRDYSRPAVTGITSDNLPYENIGKIRSHGLDFSLEYGKKLASGLELALTGIFSYNTNKVLSSGEVDLGTSGYAYAFRTNGYALGTQFGYLVDYSNGNGFFNTQEELENNTLSYQGMRAPRLGDLRFRDLNEDGIINEKDKAPLPGTKSIPNYAYSMNVALTYKNVDFSMYWQGLAGKSAYYNGAGIHEDYEQGVYSPIHEQAWTAERYANGEEIKYPALSTGGASSLEVNDFMVSKNDFVRLKNLTVGYTLPTSWVKKIGLSKIRVYFSGENLLTFTNLKFKNIDPEQSSIDAYPLYRTYNVGLNINL